MNSTRETSARISGWTKSFPPPTAVVVALAAIAALVVWVVAVPISGVPLSVQFNNASPPQEVGPIAVVVTSLVAGLAAWVSLAGLERLLKRARATWTGLAIVVLIASLLAPVTAGASNGAKATLVLLHLVVAAIVISGLRGAKHDRTPRETS